MIAATPEQGRGNAEFFVGEFLKNHGDSARAKTYLQRALDSRHTLTWYHFLAKEALSRMDEK